MQVRRAPHLPGLPALKGICCDVTPAVEEHCMTSVAPYMAFRPCHRQHHGSSYLQPVSNRQQLLCLSLLHLGEWPTAPSLCPWDKVRPVVPMTQCWQVRRTSKFDTAHLYTAPSAASGPKGDALSDTHRGSSTTAHLELIGDISSSQAEGDAPKGTAVAADGPVEKGGCGRDSGACHCPAVAPVLVPCVAVMGVADLPSCRQEQHCSCTKGAADFGGSRPGRGLQPD